MAVSGGGGPVGFHDCPRLNNFGNHFVKTIPNIFSLMCNFLRQYEWLLLGLS